MYQVIWEITEMISACGLNFIECDLYKLTVREDNSSNSYL